MISSAIYKDSYQPPPTRWRVKALRLSGVSTSQRSGEAAERSRGECRGEVEKWDEASWEGQLE